MEQLNNFYKTCALNNAKKASTVKLLEQERKENINKQISHMEKQLQAMYPKQDELVSKLLKQEIVKIDFGSSTIDVTDTSKVKTLEEFINESIEKDRQVVVEIGESLKELIETAQEDVKEFDIESQKEQSVEDFARQSVDAQEVSQVEKSQEITSKRESQKKDFIEPKYFVIEVGDKESQKQIVIDIDGNEVGIIEDEQFEMNDEYFNSQLEKYNIDDFISVKVKNFEELQRVRQEIKPKSIEQLADMDLTSGKQIVDKTTKVIEKNENEDSLGVEEKVLLNKIDKETDKSDEEKGDLEQLDELSNEGKLDKVQNYLEQNSSRKLTILIPYTLTDQLSNHQLKERGEEITVYQLKGTIKPIFVLQQGERILYGDRYNEQIQKNMSKIPYTSGVVREVSDEQTTAEVKMVDGTEKEFLIKGEPRDLNESQKEFVVSKIEELSAELNRIMDITPDDMIDFKIEFPGGIDEKCDRVDYLEMEIYKTCSQFGITPPVEIKTRAMEEVEPEELEELEEGRGERTRWDEAGNPDGSNSSMF